MIEEDTRTNESLRAAFDLHYPALIRLCLALGDQQGDAEDCVQEAFARAAPSLDGLDANVVRSYLRRAVVNIRRDRRRTSTRLAVVPARDVPDHGSAVDEREVLWNALSRLPDRQRACLVLRFYEDLAEREVAELLGYSTGTVKSHTHRA